MELQLAKKQKSMEYMGIQKEFAADKGKIADIADTTETE